MPRALPAIRAEDPRRIDARLRSLARREARQRLALGRYASAFLARQAHTDLGFARIGDYARERLGVSASHFYEVAHVSTSLSGLPEIERAVAAGRICWSKARELVTVAAPETQTAWLHVATECTADRLHALVSYARQKAARASLPANGRELHDTHEHQADDDTVCAAGAAGSARRLLSAFGYSDRRALR